MEFLDYIRIGEAQVDGFVLAGNGDLLAHASTSYTVLMIWDETSRVFGWVPVWSEHAHAFRIFSVSVAGSTVTLHHAGGKVVLSPLVEELLDDQAEASIAAFRADAEAMEDGRRFLALYAAQVGEDIQTPGQDEGGIMGDYRAALEYVYVPSVGDFQLVGAWAAGNGAIDFYSIPEFAATHGATIRAGIAAARADPDAILDEWLRRSNGLSVIRVEVESVKAADALSAAHVAILRSWSTMGT